MPTGDAAKTSPTAGAAKPCSRKRRYMLLYGLPAVAGGIVWLVLFVGLAASLFPTWVDRQYLDLRTGEIVRITRDHFVFVHHARSPGDLTAIYKKYGIRPYTDGYALVAYKAACNWGFRKWTRYGWEGPGLIVDSKIIYSILEDTWKEGIPASPPPPEARFIEERMEKWGLDRIGVIDMELLLLEYNREDAELPPPSPDEVERLIRQRLDEANLSRYDRIP